MPVTELLSHKQNGRARLPPSRDWVLRFPIRRRRNHVPDTREEVETLRTRRALREDRRRNWVGVSLFLPRRSQRSLRFKLCALPIDAPFTLHITEMRLFQFKTKRARPIALDGLVCIESRVNQWRKCRRPVKTIAIPYSLQAAITPSSRFEPPG